MHFIFKDNLQEISSTYPKAEFTMQYTPIIYYLTSFDQIMDKLIL